jgi:cytochrome c553
MMKMITVAVALLSLGVAASAVAGDADKGKAKAATCTPCHGADGNSASPDFPRIAGQNADYLTHVLAHYKAGTKRKNAIMAAMVTNLSKQDMEDLAAYFSRQQGLYLKY